MTDQGTTEGAPGWVGDADDLLEVLRLAADPITVQDADGRLVYANEAAAHQVGFDSAETFLAAPIETIVARYTLIDESGAPLAVEQLPGRRALRGEREPAAVVGFQAQGTGEMRWSIVQATPVLRDGRVRYVINAFQDITRLKEYEDRLRILADAGAVLADSDNYQDTLQALAELLVPLLADWCVVDIVEQSGLRRVAVAHPNPKMRAIAEEAQRRYPPDLDRPGGMGDVVRTGMPQVTPVITDEMVAGAARDAQHRELILSLGLRSAAIVPLIARGQVLGTMTLAGAESGHSYSDADLPFLQDLARRAAVAVDNARLLHEATEAVRLRDEFLAMASHDMRTPLQAILANLQLAGRRLQRADDGDADARAQLAQNLAQAEHTTGRLTRLVGDLLDTAMLRSGHDLPLEITMLDVVEVANRVAAEHQAGTDTHTIVVQGSAEPVSSDRQRIERVLDNLVENAIKYSPVGGEVTIQVGADERNTTIAVQDRGVGIPPEELEAIFEPYYRASNVATMPGIGLGLAGSRSVVRQLGGDLTVESAVGSGSTFIIRVPSGRRG
jgi:PAS domain S-box-containing protein